MSQDEEDAEEHTVLFVKCQSQGALGVLCIRLISPDRVDSLCLLRQQIRRPTLRDY